MKIQGSSKTQAFMDALKELENTGSPDTLVGLFAEGASLERLTHKIYEGKTGAEEFWQAYLSPFADVATEFYNVTEDDDGAVLEWVSRGHLEGGREIEYKGSSSLSFTGDKVETFRTYYDSAVFLTEGATS